MSQHTSLYCVRCGYDQSGLADWSETPEITCPECGQVNTLALIIQWRKQAHAVLGNAFFETWMAPLAIWGVTAMLGVALTIDFALFSPLLPSSVEACWSVTAPILPFVLGSLSAVLGIWHAARHTHMLRRSHLVAHGTDARSPYVRSYPLIMCIRIICGGILGALIGFVLFPALCLAPLLLLIVPLWIAVFKRQPITRKIPPRADEFTDLATQDPDPNPWPTVPEEDEEAPSPDADEVELAPAPETAEQDMPTVDAASTSHPEPAAATEATLPPPASAEAPDETTSDLAGIPKLSPKAQALARKQERQLHHPWMRLLTRCSLTGLITFLALPTLGNLISGILLFEFARGQNDENIDFILTLCVLIALVLVAMILTLAWGLHESLEISVLRRKAHPQGTSPWHTRPLGAAIGWGLLAATLVLVQLLTWLPMSIMAAIWLWRWIARRPFARIGSGVKPAYAN